MNQRERFIKNIKNQLIDYVSSNHYNDDDVVELYKDIMSDLQDDINTLENYYN